MPFCSNDQQDMVVTNLEHRWNAVRNNDLINLAMHVIPEQLPANRCFLFFLQPETEDVWLEATTGVIARQITKGWAIRRDNLQNHNGALQDWCHGSANWKAKSKR